MAKETKELSYKVIKKIATLDSDAKNPKELRLVSWDNKPEKYDIRSWWTDKNGNERMSKGVVLDSEELYSLYEILKEMYEEE